MRYRLWFGLIGPNKDKNRLQEYIISLSDDWGFCTCYGYEFWVKYLDDSSDVRVIIKMVCDTDKNVSMEGLKIMSAINELGFNGDAAWKEYE